MPENNILFKDRKGNLVASAIAGGAIMLFLAVIIFVMPEPTTFQRGVLRFFIAVGAAMLATFFLGGVVLQGNLAGSKVGAGGGFALFILIQFVFDPLTIQTVAADAAPQIVPPREEVKQAQEALFQSGAYGGAIDGIPGAATRNAIKNFQKERGLPATGYVDPATLQAFKAAEKLTSGFEGQDVVATDEQRRGVATLIHEYGLRSSLAIPVVFDTFVHTGPTNTKRFAEEATRAIGGSPRTGFSERNWLLAFLHARKQHLTRVSPNLANHIDEERLVKLRTEVETLPQ
ncbi:peptidoglycan-binding protein [Massilia suwonensis]|uniref:Peptidoglycan-binding protein n=1 Tax=Massilia suwonensis TaxID=648895 RepID=A0ABW0MIU8_9BURK